MTEFNHIEYATIASVFKAAKSDLETRATKQQKKDLELMFRYYESIITKAKKLQEETLHSERQEFLKEQYPELF